MAIIKTLKKSSDMQAVEVNRRYDGHVRDEEEYEIIDEHRAAPTETHLV